MANIALCRSLKEKDWSRERAATARGGAAVKSGATKTGSAVKNGSVSAFGAMKKGIGNLFSKKESSNPQL